MTYKIGDIVTHSETGARLAHVTSIYGPGPFKIVRLEDSSHVTVEPITGKFPQAEKGYDGFWAIQTIKPDLFRHLAKKALGKK